MMRSRSSVESVSVGEEGRDTDLLFRRFAEIEYSIFRVFEVFLIVLDGVQGETIVSFLLPEY